MPSKRAYDQAMTWLRSKAADRDSLDGVNAELVIHIMDEYRRKLDEKGAIIGRLKIREEPRDIHRL